MARDAARRLIARIEGTDESEPSRAVFPTHLVQRATTARARQGPVRRRPAHRTRAS
jgi:DNA-binding LacI/PurR family transcriptional regulator